MTFDAGRIRHDDALMHYARASNGTAIPSNWIRSTDGTTAATWRPESAGTPSYGSNSNDVGFTDAPGASSLASRADHVHRGVTSLAHSSNTYTGPVVLETEGSLYIVRSAANTYRFGSTGGGLAAGPITASGLTQATNRLLGRTTASTGAIEEITVGSGLSLSAGTLTASAGGGGAGSDAITGQIGAGGAIIPGLQGSPDIRVAGTNDDEFDTTDTSDPMTGWTTLGTPTTHDINSTALSHYHVQQTATAGTSWVGIYKACPSIPFTVTAKLAGNSHRGNYNAAGLFVAEASPGKLLVLHRGFNSGTSAGFGHLGWELFTNRTTFSTTYVGLDLVGTGPMWLRIVVTSSTNIAAYWSFDGVNWTTVETGRNPGFTVGAAGLAVKSENATYGVDATYDWIRFT